MAYPRARSYLVEAVATAIVLVLASTPTRGETGAAAYAKAWSGTHVVVTQRLYTLVYNERGRERPTAASAPVSP
jgi:hypothetical protein